MGTVGQHTNTCAYPLNIRVLLVMNKTSNNYPDHLYLLPLSSGTNHWCPPRWTNLVLKKKKKRRITADYSTTTALLPVTMREGWLQNWPEIACVLWFRARKWREVAVLLVPVRKWLEIAWLLCGLQHGIRASVPFVNQTAWTQQPPGHNNRLDTEVRDLFRERMGNAVWFSILFIPYTLLCVAIISNIFTWPVPVPLFVFLYNLLIVIVLLVDQHTSICAIAYHHPGYVGYRINIQV